MNDVIKLVINSVTPPKEYGYIEFWNPSAEQLLKLVPYLKDNCTIAFVWVYGEIEDVPDYSQLEGVGNRVVKPVWLGNTKEEAYANYTENRSKLMNCF